MSHPSKQLTKQPNFNTQKMPPTPVKEVVKEPEPKTGNSAVMDKIMNNIQDLEQRDRALDSRYSDLLRQLEEVKGEQFKVKGRLSALSATLLMLEQTEQRAQHIFEIS